MRIPLTAILLCCSDSMYNLYRLELMFRRFYDNYHVNLRGYSSPSPKKGIEKKSISQNFFLNQDGLLRKRQDRNCYNKYTRFSPETLKERSFRKILKGAMKKVEMREEQLIQEGFSKKLKSRRWKKRHHQ